MDKAVEEQTLQTEDWQEQTRTTHWLQQQGQHSTPKQELFKDNNNGPCYLLALGEVRIVIVKM